MEIIDKMCSFDLLDQIINSIVYYLAVKNEAYHWNRCEVDLKDNNNKINSMQSME